MPCCPSITSAELIDSRWRMRKSNVNTAIGAPLWQPSRPAWLYKSSGTLLQFQHVRVGRDQWETPKPLVSLAGIHLMWNTLLWMQNVCGYLESGFWTSHSLQGFTKNSAQQWLGGVTKINESSDHRSSTRHEVDIESWRSQNISITFWWWPKDWQDVGKTNIAKYMEIHFLISVILGSY